MMMMELSDELFHKTLSAWETHSYIQQAKSVEGVDRHRIHSITSKSMEYIQQQQTLYTL